ncbi:MAG: saccharopine dehydrogenase NADP-binding domain-containing protein, partial [Casimicrobium sp.]
MKIALLGAGHIGHTISHLLVNSGDYQVTVADQSSTSLDKLKHLKVERTLIDTEKA